MSDLRQRLVALASRFPIGREDAEDIAQETMLRLCAAQTNGCTVRDENAFAWRTASRLAIERLRTTRRRSAKWADIARSSSTIAELPDPPPDVERLYEAISRLPARQSAVITLRKLMELEYAEIASILGISEDACRSHCKLGLRRLREILPE